MKASILAVRKMLKWCELFSSVLPLFLSYSHQQHGLELIHLPIWYFLTFSSMSLQTETELANGRSDTWTYHNLQMGTQGPYAAVALQDPRESGLVDHVVLEDGALELIVRQVEQEGCVTGVED